MYGTAKAMMMIKRDGAIALAPSAKALPIGLKPPSKMRPTITVPTINATPMMIML